DVCSSDLAGAAVLSSRMMLAHDATPAAGHNHGHEAEASPHVAHGGTPASTADATPVATPFEGVTGQPLVQPDVRESSAGVLETQLEAKLSPTTVAGRDVTSTVYEGSFPGPTLALWPGDTLRLKLINSLDEATNIHTHGFHVSPKDNSDNIYIHIGAGE